MDDALGVVLIDLRQRRIAKSAFIGRDISYLSCALIRQIKIDKNIETYIKIQSIFY